MNQTEYEKYLKTFKKDKLIERVMRLEKELTKCESDLDARETKLKEQSVKLKELEEFKKETDNWSLGLIKTLLYNEDKNCKLVASLLEENINEIIDARIHEKLETEIYYYEGEEHISVKYDGCEV